MVYPDRFLDALGAWQRGWREDQDRRLIVTRELRAAIEALPHPLPISAPLPGCYRKRFLVPNNPQNGGDFLKLILAGEIVEGPASWTTDPTFHLEFKRNPRVGQLTALFHHLPRADEVLVDIVALWRDPIFVTAVEDYIGRGGEEAESYKSIAAGQKEMVLTAPLLIDEFVDAVGDIGDENFFHAALGASTDSEREAVSDALMAAKIALGAKKWAGGDAVRRAVQRTRLLFTAKLHRRLRRRHFRHTLKLTASPMAIAAAIAKAGSPPTHAHGCA